MFGGHGIFQDGKMFGIINSKGEVSFKVDDTNRSQYELMGSRQHGKMPYCAVPKKTTGNPAKLRKLAKLSIKIAHLT